MYCKPCVVLYCVTKYFILLSGIRLHCNVMHFSRTIQSNCFNVWHRCALQCNVWHCIALNCIKLIALHCSEWHFIILYFILWYHIVFWWISFNYTYTIALYHYSEFVLCYMTLHCNILHLEVLYDIPLNWGPALMALWSKVCHSLLAVSQHCSGLITGRVMWESCQWLWVKRWLSSYLHYLILAGHSLTWIWHKRYGI